MFDNFFIFFTLLGNYALVWFGLAVAVALQQKKKAKQIMVATVLAIGYSYILTTFFKLLFQIPRPTYYILNTKYCPTDFSFPSGHASTSFAVAVVLSHFDPKRRWLYFILASLISYSRLYLNCHHTVDVVVGAVLGAIISSIVLKITTNQSKPVAKAKRSR